MNLSKLMVLIFTMLFSFNLFSLDFDYIIDKDRCKPVGDNEEILYGTDFKWNVNREEMTSTYKKLYNSNKRLQHRAYYDSSRDVFLIKSGYTNNDIELAPRFIISMARHFEKALTNKYAEVPMFSDMGHNHFFIPSKLWDDKYSKLSDDREALYEEFFKEPKLVMFYHTAEQLKMVDDQDKVLDDTYLQRRYYTRNIHGDNSMTGSMDMVFSPIEEYNTVSLIDDHRSWSAGVNMSANKDGCFAFKLHDKLIYFDISLFDLPYKNIGFDIY